MDDVNNVFSALGNLWRLNIISTLASIVLRQQAGDRQAGSEIGRETGRQGDKQGERQAGREAGREAGRQRGSAVLMKPKLCPRSSLLSVKSVTSGAPGPRGAPNTVRSTQPAHPCPTFIPHLSSLLI